MATTPKPESAQVTNLETELDRIEQQMAQLRADEAALHAAATAFDMKVAIKTRGRRPLGTDLETRGRSPLVPFHDPSTTQLNAEASSLAAAYRRQAEVLEAMQKGKAF